MTAHRTHIFGIVNITEDSFSDGGQFLNPEAAIAHAAHLLAAGADVLDIGPASSHPDARDVSAEEEIERLSAIWPGLRAMGSIIPALAPRFLTPATVTAYPTWSGSIAS